jgi:DNA-binding NtrC family response regulator
MPEKLLIVDDEPDMLKLLSMIIKANTAYEFATTNNPLEALEMAKGGGYDLLLTDLKMPGLDGIELLNAVREFDQEIPIIIITAYATAESAAEAMDKNAFDFITKPFRKEQVIFTIEKAMKWLRTQRENRVLREQLNKG